MKERTAYQAGYRVEGGTIKSPSGKILKGWEKAGGYLFISTGSIAGNIAIHRLVAFQKFGNAIYQPGIEVRHLNGNPSDYSESNISIGTKVENAADKSPALRLRAAVNASRHAQKWDHTAIVLRYHDGASYTQIMSEFGIKSKGTVSFIIRQSMAATKAEAA